MGQICSCSSNTAEQINNKSINNKKYRSSSIGHTPKITARQYSDSTSVNNTKHNAYTINTTLYNKSNNYHDKSTVSFDDNNNNNINNNHITTTPKHVNIDLSDIDNNPVSSKSYKLHHNSSQQQKALYYHPLYRSKLYNQSFYDVTRKLRTSISDNNLSTQPYRQEFIKKHNQQQHQQQNQSSQLQRQNSDQEGGRSLLRINSHDINNSHDNISIQNNHNDINHDDNATTLHASASHPSLLLSFLHEINTPLSSSDDEQTAYPEQRNNNKSAMKKVSSHHHMSNAAFLHEYQRELDEDNSLSQ